MKEQNEQAIFSSATKAVTEDAGDAERLIAYLQSRNAKLIEMEKQEQKPSIGGKLADIITAFGGSWTFIISFIVILMLWVTINVISVLGQWDPYPFILLNLCLSTVAALQAPIILMSQNRQAERDRLNANIDLERDRLDLEVDTFAAKVTHDAMLEIKNINARLERIEKKLRK